MRGAQKHWLRTMPLKWRAVVFVVVTTTVLTVLLKYDDAAMRTVQYPPPNFLGSTWYGPLVLLLIPISLGWLSVAAKSRGARVFGFTCTGVVFLLALLFIYNLKRAVHTLPDWLYLYPPGL
jgi:amino acid permease